MGLEKLIQKCKKQDIKAQEELYRLYAQRLFGVCLKYSTNYQQAEDNLQDGFLTIFKKISQYQDKGSFEGWMKRIIINTALQKYRKEKYLDIINEDLLEEQEIEIDEEDLSVDFLLKLIQELPPRYREVFNLYALDGYSHKEISGLLNISQGSSKSNLARARGILKERIENHQNNNSVRSL
ncbi:MAG: sigma-70 family RNA polymerase sigma factor [Salegentibacter sp.]|uniref:RNA polymerase sigma-70 factor, ECF subfamily n=1 Tax=Salegentibacter flavus TaxID=287099 RepID=A0A1I4ZZW2_9FLAO|nr:MULTISPECIES: sigma-70 family RNA polymerase sigma factor [Salegentibacter]MDR9457548.1 sigma-70 family RNA polymerase sigma factor [Salegentibacter sp.]SFN55688.1 RNA polymerase sigma-70 factor, ECF subfamily [Salegentibacter flavus]